MCLSVGGQQMCFVSVANLTLRGPSPASLTACWHCWKRGTDFLSFTNCLIQFHREKQERTRGRWVRFLMKRDPIDCSCNTTLFSFITLTFHSPWTLVSLWNVYKWTHVCLRPNDVTKNVNVKYLCSRAKIYLAAIFPISHPPVTSTGLFLFMSATSFFISWCTTRKWDLNSWADLICWIEF